MEGASALAAIGTCGSAITAWLGSEGVGSGLTWGGFMQPSGLVLLGESRLQLDWYWAGFDRGVELVIHAGATAVASISVRSEAATSSGLLSSVRWCSICTSADRTTVSTRSTAVWMAVRWSSSV